MSTMPEASLDRVVVVGGGFGGLRLAQVLASAPVKVTLIDRRDFHTFQPLVYQVATAMLDPAAMPTRTLVWTAGVRANPRASWPPSGATPPWPSCPTACASAAGWPGGPGKEADRHGRGWCHHRRSTGQPPGRSILVRAHSDYECSDHHHFERKKHGPVHK